MPLDVDQREARCRSAAAVSNPMFTDRTLHLDAGMPLDSSLEDALRNHEVTYNKLAYSVL